MNINELNIHFAHVRQMQNNIRDLEERIDADKSDDADNLRKSYENIQKEIRYLLSRHYNAEIK